jgi:hypothetical protein
MLAKEPTFSISTIFTRLESSILFTGRKYVKVIDQAGRTTNGIISNDGSVFEK